MVQAGTFRQDLYYRLNVFPLVLPPLRSRREDIASLAETILGRLARRFGQEPQPLTQRALQRIEAYDWPGNIRELNNVLERALILSGGGPIGLEHIVLDPDIAVYEVMIGAPATVRPTSDGDAKTLRDVERSTILRILRECNGNRTHASERLGISLRTLRNRLREYRGEGVAVPEPERIAV
jgi:DNA-binding NtrC family response regulator